MPGCLSIRKFRAAQRAGTPLHRHRLTRAPQSSRCRDATETGFSPSAAEPGSCATVDQRVVSRSPSRWAARSPPLGERHPSFLRVVFPFFMLASMDRLVAWFADASNGIKEFFSERLHTQELCTTRSDGVEVCANADQLAAILAGTAAGAPAAIGVNAGAPSGSSTSGPPDADTATTTHRLRGKSRRRPRTGRNSASSAHPSRMWCANYTVRSSSSAADRRSRSSTVEVSWTFLVSVTSLCARAPRIIFLRPILNTE
jgi:hypothetical protein